MEPAKSAGSALLAGRLALLSVPAVLFAFWRERKQQLELTATEKFWLRCRRRSRKTRSTQGWLVEHYVTIAAAFRQWLGLEVETTTKVLEAVADDPEAMTPSTVL